jgi:putative ABC transport system permease protein
MRDWRSYVRERLSLPAFPPEREAEAIDELAHQLEDVARSAMAAGATDAEASAIAEQHVQDWTTLANEIAKEDRLRLLPIDRRLADRAGLGASQGWWRRATAGLASDLLYGVRMFRLNPGFTLIAVLTLAAGIGSTAALFGIVDSVLLRPLPFRDSDRLLRLISLRTNGEPGGISYPDFLDWRSRSHAFDGMAVYTPRNFVLREQAGAGITQVRGAVVSEDLFTILGASAIAGRTFVQAEYGAGQPTTVVLGHRLWRDRFGSDPQVVGRSIELDRKPATVVGVMPQGFTFPIEPDPIELWTTIAVDNRDAKSLGAQRGVHYLNGIGRLAPGASVEQAQAELGSIVSALNKEHPESDPRGVLVRPELGELVAEVRSVWLALFGAAGCLLLIACANVVNMLLARAASRRKELAVRFALGAGRGRLVRQLLTEHALLGGAGGALGLVFANWCITILKLAAPRDVPRLQQAGLNGSVLLFTIAASFGAVVLFGVMPALHASGSDPARLASLAGRDRSDEAGGRIRRGLVVVQIALAMVLLVGGALLIGTVVRLQRVDPGFSPTHLVTFRLDLPDEYPTDREGVFYRELLDRLRSMPGVRAASAAYAMPFSGRDLTTTTEIEGRQAPPGAHDETIFNIIQPGLFETLGVRLLEGRDFTERDSLTSPPVAIVNEAFVRRFFASANPIGRHVKPGIGNGYEKDPLREIVGVAPDLRAASLRNAPEPQVYVPAAQCPSIGNAMVVVRTDLDEQDVARMSRRVVTSLDRSVPVSRVKTIEQYIFASVVQPRFSSLLLGLFAVLSSTLAAVGLYGLISYAVAQRTREIGVRLALGAAPRSVLTMILRQGAAISLAGIAVGVVAALIFTSGMTSLLYGVGPRDPTIFAGVACLLFFVALLACAVPAARAMRVNPITALRSE